MVSVVSGSTVNSAEGHPVVDVDYPVVTSSAVMVV